VDYAFNPASLTISAGTTVVWTNNGQAPHTTTSDTQIWESGTLNNGQSFSYQFNTPGTYPYHCEIHTSMQGTIVVTAGDTVSGR
jgi:plastocyanin